MIHSLEQLKEEMKKKFDPEDTRLSDPLHVEGYNYAIDDMISKIKERDEWLEREVENLKYTGFHRECKDGSREECDECLHRDLTNARLDRILSLIKQMR